MRTMSERREFSSVDSHFTTLFIILFYFYDSYYLWNLGKKDWKIWVHHLFTIITLSTALILGYDHISVFCLLLHENCDIFIELALLFDFIENNLKNPQRNSNSFLKQNFL